MTAVRGKLDLNDQNVQRSIPEDGFDPMVLCKQPVFLLLHDRTTFNSQHEYPSIQQINFKNARPAANLTATHG
ncbi:hypothetical protein [Burkholderia ubonensis]|uniref:hypothetical protein n=1 Tax=Burkholderia ubonensis TaxID=101571 RepID=UPI0011603006|nr:hypothetical protein [Burkholderia ubonensis]